MFVIEDLILTIQNFEIKVNIWYITVESQNR